MTTSSLVGSKAPLALACMLAGAGLTLALVQLWPARRSAVESVAPTSFDAPTFSLPLRPKLETTVDKESAPSVAAEIREAAARSLRGDALAGRLGVEARERLHAAVEEQARIYLTGDFDRHWSFIQRTGGRRAYLDEVADDETERASRFETIRQVWESTVKPYALKPVSPSDVALRVRYLRGQRVPSPDDAAARATITNPDRWPALSGDPEANQYTIVELMLPVFYAEPPDRVGPVYLGIWFVWDDADRDWKIHQTRVYDPLRIGPSVVPMF